MAKKDEETLWVLEENDAIVARKVSGRNFRFGKTHRKVQKQKSSHRRGGFHPFRKSASGGTTRHVGEQLLVETKFIHPMRMAKEKVDRIKANRKRSQPSQRNRRSILPHCKLSLPMPVGMAKIGVGFGAKQAGTHPMRYPVQRTG